MCQALRKRNEELGVELEQKEADTEELNNNAQELADLDRTKDGVINDLNEGLSAAKKKQKQNNNNSKKKELLNCRQRSTDETEIRMTTAHPTTHPPRESPPIVWTQSTSGTRRSLTLSSDTSAACRMLCALPAAPVASSAILSRSGRNRRVANRR